MKIIILMITMTVLSFAAGPEKIKMYYNNEEITKIIEMYSKASGQKFVVDPAVRGKISIFIQEPISLSEAFNHLSTSLALNGYAISKQGDLMVVQSGRNIQRDLIEVGTERPALTPQRMFTWIYSFKNTSAEEVNRNIRILVSKDGEMNVNLATNQLIITDWVTNLNRVSDILKEIDKKMDPLMAKAVEADRRREIVRINKEVDEIKKKAKLEKKDL